jgi:hypothetical protein
LPFHIHIPDAEQAYLDNLPLSPEAKEQVDRFVAGVIANISDQFRLDPANRPDPSKPYFMIREVLVDIWGDSSEHRIDFHIRDDKAGFGSCSSSSSITTVDAWQRLLAALPAFPQRSPERHPLAV